MSCPPAKSEKAPTLHPSKPIRFNPTECRLVDGEWHCPPFHLTEAEFAAFAKGLGVKGGELARSAKGPTA